MSNRSIYGIRKLAEYKELMKRHRYVVIKVEADWCGPCQSMKPQFAQEVAKLPEEVAQFAQEVSNLPEEVAIAIVDIDQSPELKRNFRITSVPLLFNVINGDVLDMLNSSNQNDVSNFFIKTINRIKN
jgi:thiol-disulfide isomerase/thioredoxin